jgi:hypothetical protein
VETRHVSEGRAKAGLQLQFGNLCERWRMNQPPLESRERLRVDRLRDELHGAVGHQELRAADVVTAEAVRVADRGMGRNIREVPAII